MQAINVLPLLNRVEQGVGRVDRADTLRLRLVPARDHAHALAYANAQLDDYQGLPRSRFPHRPPLSLTVRARFLGNPESMKGTGGFGFWNAPFGGGRRVPVLPTAIWFFFGGQACDMRFAHGVAGRGWKAATIHAHSGWGYGLASFAPIGALLFRRRRVYDRVWPWLQGRLGISETILPGEYVGEWHEYAIEWGSREIVFRIDNKIVARTQAKIMGPLGLVIWIDNQYLIATPQGVLSSGVVGVNEEQQLEVEAVTLFRPIKQASRED